MAGEQSTITELHDRFVEAAKQSAKYSTFARSGRWGESTQQRDREAAMQYEEEVIRLQGELKQRSRSSRL